MENKTMAWVSVFFGVVFGCIGSINIFWGNDTLYGIFVFLLSGIYYPRLQAQIETKTGFKISRLIKIITGIFIIWSSMGVGELPEKIEMMNRSLRG